MDNILKIRIHRGLALRLSALTPLNHSTQLHNLRPRIFVLMLCGWFIPIYLSLSVLKSYLIYTHFFRNTARA
jgi:hypothetical protein